MSNIKPPSYLLINKSSSHKSKIPSPIYIWAGMGYGQRNINAIMWREVKTLLRAFVVLGWVWAFVIFRNDYLRSKEKSLKRNINTVAFMTDTLPPDNFLTLYNAISDDMTVSYISDNRTYSILKKDEKKFLGKHPKVAAIPARDEGYYYLTPKNIAPKEPVELELIPGISFERTPKNPYKFAAQVARPQDFLKAVYYDVCATGKGFYKSEREFRFAMDNPEYAYTVFRALSVHGKNFLNSTVADSLLARAAKDSGTRSFLNVLYDYAVGMDESFGKKIPYASFTKKLKDKKYATSIYYWLSNEDEGFAGHFTEEGFITALQENKAMKGTMNYLSIKGETDAAFNDNAIAFEYVPFERFKTLINQPDYKDKLYLTFKHIYNLARRSEFEYNMATGARYEKITLKETHRLAVKKASLEKAIDDTKNSKWDRKKTTRFLLWMYPIIVLVFYAYRLIFYYLKGKHLQQPPPFLRDLSE